MGRPCKLHPAIEAILARHRAESLKPFEDLFRPCPATATCHPDYRKVCDKCTGVVCARMREKGLAEDGSPLPRRDCPCCNAKARTGGACKKKVIPGKTKCRYHGGLSTGPKTEAGKARVAAAQRLRWALPRRERPPDKPEVLEEKHKIAEKRRRFGYRRIGMIM